MELVNAKGALTFGWMTLFLLLTHVAEVGAETTATALFENKVGGVYQVRVIDIASGDKYSIGSGFRISDVGHLATNFHVVSSYVHEPEKYRLEYIAADDSVGDLKLLAVDVVHDLAIVHTGEKTADYLALAEGRLSKGERIYSMGNPHDLGMTIIEGTYNGLVENSRYRKILFSGSLNAGMSGGPALNAEGKVIGINVSKGGEQISFLVPVHHLSTLLDSIGKSDDVTDFGHAITKALTVDQNQFYEALLDAPLIEKQMGNLVIPQKLHESLNCWGHTVDEEDIKYEAIHQHCESEDQIFVSDNLFLGAFNYDVELISSAELNRFQFYSLLEERFQHSVFDNTYGKEDVTDYTCYDNLVNLDSGAWKISTCFRAYKRYAGLYDSSMLMVSMDRPDHAAIVKVSGSGSNSENALAVFKRVMGEISWKH